MAQGRKTKSAAKVKKTTSAAKLKKAAPSAVTKSAGKSAVGAKGKKPAATARKTAGAGGSKKPVAAARSGARSASSAGKTAARSRTSSAAQPKKAGSAAAGKPVEQPERKAPVKSSRSARKTPRLPHLDSKTLEALIKKLRELREESQRLVNTHVQADLQHREEGGEVGDDMDQASNERDREFTLLIHQRHLRRLKQIDDAFERIDDGSYGLCEGTEEPINPKRLLIMPLARFSLEYQQQQEKTLGRSPEDGMSGGEETLITDE